MPACEQVEKTKQAANGAFCLTRNSGESSSRVVWHRDPGPRHHAAVSIHMRADRWWLIIKQLGARLLHSPAACLTLRSFRNRPDHSKLQKLRLFKQPVSLARKHVQHSGPRQPIVTAAMCAPLVGVCTMQELTPVPIMLSSAR